jgi:AraC-like DNA-binding protein
MHYQEFSPSPTLRDYIKCFWIMERDFQPLHDAVDVLPDSYSEVIFNFGDACQIGDGQSSLVLPACYRVGLFDQPFRLYARGLLKTIGVRFYAWGFHPLFGASTPEQSPVADIFYLLDRGWHRLAGELRQVLAQGDAGAIAYLDAYLVEQSNALRLPADHLLTDLPTWIQPSEQTTVDVWADANHLSRRQLERRFQKMVGLSPKALARRVRFERSRDQLCRQPESDLATLAHAYGYADQAHFGRDFKHFTHRTPGQFVLEIRDMPEALRYGVAFLPHF